MNAKEKRDTIIELRSRKIVKRKLEVALRSLQPKIEKVKEDREKRKEHLSEYRNYNDLQDAYGWGFITEEEFDALAIALEQGTEAIDNEISEHEIAASIISGWLKITDGDIASLEFDLMPESKKKKIRDESYEILKRREERRIQNERQAEI